MQTLRDTALRYLGTPYLFDGKSFNAFDCSGFVCELLRGVGVLHWNDTLSAQGIHDFLEKSGSVDKWGMGSIAFYGKSATAIDHVALCLDAFRMIEAGGGNSETIDIQHAIARNACVRVRPIKYRIDFLKVIRPNYFTIGYSA